MSDTAAKSGSEGGCWLRIRARPWRRRFVAPLGPISGVSSHKLSAVASMADNPKSAKPSPTLYVPLPALDGFSSLFCGHSQPSVGDSRGTMAMQREVCDRSSDSNGIEANSGEK